MRLIRLHLRVVVLTLGVVAAGLSTVLPALAAKRFPAPVLRVLVASHQYTVTHPAFQAADYGVFIASSSAAFEVTAEFPRYGSKPVVVQWLRNGDARQARDLPSNSASVALGLREFFRLTLTDMNGHVALDQLDNFCPQAVGAERLNDSGPATSSYPRLPCFTPNPFGLGNVFGIERGWAIPIFTPGASSVARNLLPGSNPGNVPDGRYNLSVSITPRFRQIFGVDATNASTTATIVLTTSSTPAVVGGSEQGADATLQSAQPPPAEASLPAGTTTLPDLIPLPAWQIGVSHVGAQDLLNFAATVWDRGPSPLVVEGFRRTNTNIMNAYQYFYRNGVAVGKRPIGTLYFDPRPGHDHWHFSDFASYSLLNASQHVAVTSSKDGFCIAPTDAIDLTVPGAEWQTETASLSTACGTQEALWIREALPTGWGDTYHQALPGQSFDITNLPNGTYYVDIHANPNKRLLESNTANNVTLRKVILGGEPGNRSVQVPAYKGINVP